MSRPQCVNIYFWAIEDKILKKMIQQIITKLCIVECIEEYSNVSCGEVFLISYWPLDLMILANEDQRNVSRCIMLCLKTCNYFMFIVDNLAKNVLMQVCKLHLCKVYKQ